MINAAVIGTGYIGPLTIEALRRLGDVKVKGVCDANLDLARRIAAKYDIEKVYADWQEAVEDPSINVVHTCSPNRLHYAMNKASIEAGKHILSEKPLAMTLAEAEDLTGLADKRGIVTGVNFCYRYYPLVLEMASRVLRGQAGEVRMVTGTWFQDWLSRPEDWSWRLEREESGPSNTAADLGSHWFDLVQFITGMKVTEVMADFATLIPVHHKPVRQVVAFETSKNAQFQEVRAELEDYAAVLFRLSNGAPGSFTTCQAATGRKSDTEIQVYGSEYSLAWDHRRSNQLWIGHRDKPNETLIEGPILQDPASGSYASLPAGHPLGYHDALLNLFKDFYEDVKAGGQERQRALPRPTFRSGTDEMRILKAVVDSVEKRAWVKV
jgi:predicted dehydrogenase